jgi:hypothetical protein
VLRCSLVLVAITACTRGDDVPSPAISTITPDHAQPGVTITIAGDFFCQQPEEEERDPFACANVGGVEVGQVPATVGMYTDTLITFEVPNLPSGSVGIAVVVHAHRSNTIGFVVD